MKGSHLMVMYDFSIVLIGSLNKPPALLDAVNLTGLGNEYIDWV